MAVGARVAVVRAVDVAARNVMVFVNRTVREDAFAGELPLAQEERLGRVRGVDGPNVACVVGVGAVFGGDHGQVSPIDTKHRVLRSSTALSVPGFNGVGFSGPVAEEMVVRNGVVNPSVSIECSGAAAPFFWGHVGVSTAVGPVPTIVCAGATKPAPNFVVLRPRNAFRVGNGGRI